MNLDRINHLNSLLMILALAGAILIPIEVFLFAYAILGPLHYLTEISWLHDRKYFSQSKKDAVWLILIATIISLGYFNNKFNISNDLKTYFIENNLNAFLIILAFVMSFGFFYIKKNHLKISFMITSLIICFLTFRNQSDFSNLTSLLLPTIAHVYLFTGFFIFVGALKSNSKSAYLSLCIYVCCPLILWTFLPDISSKVTDYGVENFFKHQEGFGLLIYDLLGFLPEHYLTPLSGSDLYDFKEELFLVRFLSFAYLYHYLNWFSKTEIIKWNQIPKTRLYLILVLWILSCAIYAFDYMIGMSVLFFLSYCHVLLEFPLNMLSMKEILKSIKSKIS